MVAMVVSLLFEIVRKVKNNHRQTCSFGISSFVLLLISRETLLLYHWN